MRTTSVRGLIRITVFVALSVGSIWRSHAQMATLHRSPANARTAPMAASLESIVPNRLVVIYRGGVEPLKAESLLTRAGAKLVAHLPLFGASAVQTDGEANATIAALLQQPEVSAVLHDRYVKAYAMQVLPVRIPVAPPQPARVTEPATADISVVAIPSIPFPKITKSPVTYPIQQIEGVTYYASPQGWATRLAGGYGAQIPGGLATGPWNATEGEGIRIAVLDSGVDADQPNVAPNLALNLSEIDQVALPSICDTGSPQDQVGHGTFTASLAAATTGGGTGMIIGVAPQAQILNIKVVQRMPAASGATPLAQCEAGEANGLLSWVLLGIQDAVANHATIISLSLGTLVDVSTGDGAGWVAQMDSVTYAAEQAGVVLVAATGNDGLDLSSGTYVELPAQARGVLPIVASTNPACAENLAPNATCLPGSITRASYSNFGSSLNAIASPGGSSPEGAGFAVSGYVRGACSQGLPETTDGLPSSGQSFGCFGLGHIAYVQATGTSAAAPLVAGAVAMVQAAHPDWTPSQVIAALRSSAEIQGNMTEPELDLPAALKLQ